MFTKIVLDATGKIPDGIFRGNLNAFGNYRECIGIETPAILRLNDETFEGFQ